jgi:acetyl-CoA carboxylase carboxyl transferase subunit beta
LSVVEARASHWSAVPPAGAELPPLPVPDRCPGCGGAAFVELLRRRLYVCECGHHLSLSVEAWIALLADPGSWREHWAQLRPADVLGWTEPVAYRAILGRAAAAHLNESVVTGSCDLGGIAIKLAIFDFRFLGGTLGMVSGERLARAMEAAITAREPFLLIAASGGARMQEGALALMQMPKVNAVVCQLHDARIAFISVLTHPTYGGTAASLALLADVNIAEPGAAIGFSGPRVIHQATFAELPDGFQSAAFQQEHGHIDFILPRAEIRQRLAQLLAFYSGPG